MSTTAITDETRAVAIMRKYVPLDVDRLLGPGTRTVTVAASRDPNAKLTVLLFRPSATVPELVVKLPTTVGAAVAIDAEATTLTRVREHLDPTLCRSVPEVVARIPGRYGDALVTTAVGGVPMTTRYHRWRHVSRRSSVARDFEAAGRWLARLHAVTAGPAQPVDYVGALSLRIHLRFRTAPLRERVLEHLDCIDRRLRSCASPRTVVHGDYWAGNVLTDKSEVTGVVDWEAGSERDAPVRDLVRFALAYSLSLDRHTRAGHLVSGHPGLCAGSWGAGLHYAIDGSGWYPELVHEFMSLHLARLGVGAGRVRDVLVAGVAECSALADDPDFARRHYDVLAALCRRGGDRC